MTPKFAVGEVVILQSREAPQCNGECTVLEILPPSVFNVSWGYVTTTPLPEKFILLEGWSESALRKKHQPGELSFDKLMSSLSQPVQEPLHS